jgi:RHS repeat-associated protein
LTEYVYDGGDRVAMVNSQEFVTYDSRGYVVKRGETTYKYNALGQMTSASEAARFSIQFYYDDVGRIVAKKDHRANVVQFVYANPYNNNSVTHVHYPKAARTYHMIYDDETGQLIAMDTPDSRYYVGTDNLGSPIAVFDSKGRLVKELVRSPFGQVVRDTNPSMDLSVDFAGGLIDQYTHLVHIGDRVYDPVLGQWMTPDWTKVASTGMTNAFDVFSYRFHNNDPVNINRNTKDMTGTTKLLFF